MAANTAPPSPRRTLHGGRYAIVDQIGHGAFSTVWRARDLLSGHLVAIKEVRNLHDKGILKRLLREIRLLRHFRKTPYIVHILDAFTQQSKDSYEEIYIVCELMDYDLHKLLSSPTLLDRNHLKLFAYQILLGLKYMHSASVLHRDLKPKNILVNRSGEIKICDLGMGRTGSSDAGRSQLKMTLLTEVATPYYRAPDGILNLSASSSSAESTGASSGSVPDNSKPTSAKPSNSSEDPSPTPSDPAPPRCASYTSAVDMWAFGCILAELVLRKPIFPGKTNKDLLELILKVLGSPSKALMARIPEGGYKRLIESGTLVPATSLKELFPATTDPLLIDLVAKLLKFDPQERLSVDDALAHPYLEELHDLEEESLLKPPKFKFPEDDEEKDTRDSEQYRALLWQELALFSSESSSSNSASI